MKVSAAGLALLLISASFSQTFSGPAGLEIPTCCFTYSQHKLPRRLIQHHYSTSSNCPQPGIVFVTKEGRQVCANPENNWVQSYLRILGQN
ncbi:C-C motif chemokine 4 homolog [Zonotrichia albicollis]|uniref:C-C motif chemokine 4 homolog n=1 Tax=Zonotrichia albicollis TaxID=44394 RepID=UPI003D812515